jgi:hypothetical protein
VAEIPNPDQIPSPNPDGTFEAPTRDAQGRFLPGVSGNRRGRPRGRWGEALQALVPKAIGALEAALDNGDVGAIAQLLARTVPTLKPEADLVEFELDTTATPPEQRRQIREAVAQGRLTLEQAHQMTDLLDKHQAGDEWHPLIERLKRRKAKHAQQPAQIINPVVRTADGKVTISYPGQFNGKDTVN